MNGRAILVILVILDVADATLRDTRSVCQGVVSYAVFARLECTPDGLR